MKRKLYDIVVDENDESGMDFNSWVKHPAHEMQFIQFNKDKRKLQFNEEKRIVTGVLIAADKPILRVDADTGEEYDVQFSAKTIELIKNKWFKNNFNTNLNLEHNPNNIVTDGVYMVDSYIVSNSDDNYPKAPNAFSDLDLKDGSWIGSYKVENDELWEKAKKGEFNGFSVEILSGLKSINKNKSKMKNKKKFWERRKKTFASAETIDSKVFFEGSLEAGTKVFSDEEMTTPVTDASLIVKVGEEFKALELEEGTVKSVTDAEAFAEAEEEIETVEEELVSDISDIIQDADEDASFDTVAEEIVDHIIDVIAEADEEEFSKFEKFKDHKILVALSEARAKKEEKKTPKKKFKKNKTNGKPAEEPKRVTFADLREKLKK